MIVCPKCGYERKPEDDEFVPDTQCPKCSAVYQNFEAYSLKNKIRELENELKYKQELLLQNQNEMVAYSAKVKEENEIYESIWKKINLGQKCFIYKKLYIPVDSIIDGEQQTEWFDIDKLNEFGLQGWEVIAVVPRTLGKTYKNQSTLMSPGHGIMNAGESWGAAMGGNIIGVHIILKKELIPSLKDEFDKDIKNILKSD